VINTQSGSLMSVGIIGALWAASGAVRMVMKSMNKAYDVPESRPWYRKYPLSVGLTLLAGVSVIGAAALMFVGQIWATDIMEAIGLGGWVAGWGRSSLGCDGR
jgi:membrane protein